MRAGNGKFGKCLKQSSFAWSISTEKNTARLLCRDCRKESADCSISRKWIYSAAQLPNGMRKTRTRIFVPDGAAGVGPIHGNVVRIVVLTGALIGPLIEVESVDPVALSPVMRDSPPHPIKEKNNVV